MNQQTNNDLKPAFLEDDDGPFEGFPSHSRTISASELFGMRPGETVAQAAARKEREMTGDMTPAFLDDDGPSEPHFSHYRTISASEIFGQQPGETLGEAIARKAAKG
jgi:hypothetical protein